MVTDDLMTFRGLLQDRVLVGVEPRDDDSILEAPGSPWRATIAVSQAPPVLTASSLRVRSADPQRRCP